MIKWCVYLCHLSSSLYEALRQSGCVTLPSQRTLRDYTHFACAQPGFSVDTDQQLLEAMEVQADLSRVEEASGSLMDEMHIKADLVHDKFTGELLIETTYIYIYIYIYIYCFIFILHTYYIAGGLLGFTNLGEIDTHLTRFEWSLEEERAEYQPLAKSMLVVMVRGLYSSLQFPYAQFPCTSVRGDQLFTLARLERYGVKVLGMTCDGLSANRRLFRTAVETQNSRTKLPTPTPVSQDIYILHFRPISPYINSSKLLGKQKQAILGKL